MKQSFVGSYLFFSIFALIGTLMAVGAVSSQWNDYQLTRKGVRTQGIVARLVSNGKSAAPVIEFYTPDHVAHSYTGKVFSSPPAYRPGETVTLWYDPADPEKIVISGLDQWFVPAILGFFALVFCSLGYGALVYKLAYKPKDKSGA